MSPSQAIVPQKQVMSPMHSMHKCVCTIKLPPRRQKTEKPPSKKLEVLDKLDAATANFGLHNSPPLAATQVLFIHQIKKRIGREGCSR